MEGLFIAIVLSAVYLFMILDDPRSAMRRVRERVRFRKPNLHKLDRIFRSLHIPYDLQPTERLDGKRDGFRYHAFILRNRIGVAPRRGGHAG